MSSERGDILEALNHHKNLSARAELSSIVSIDSPDCSLSQAHGPPPLDFHGPFGSFPMILTLIFLYHNCVCILTEGHLGILAALCPVHRTGDHLLDHCKENSDAMKSTHLEIGSMASGCSMSIVTPKISYGKWSIWSSGRQTISGVLSWL